MIRLGLCCLFREAPITFRSTTARHLAGFPRAEQLARLSALCLHNARSLRQALQYAATHAIGAFRVLSQFFPLFTHPELGYGLDELPAAGAIRAELAAAARFRAARDLRLSFHPDQFIVLSSPRPEVVASGSRELAYQAQVAELIGAEVINVHGGGAYGDKKEALARFARHFRELPEGVRKRLTVENDDTSYTVRDLLPLCQEIGIPLVYDIHHHRCLPDGLSEPEATRLAAATWERAGREPYFHLSSPRHGWGSGKPRPHADYIDPADFPACWRGLSATIDIEAKAKELAVLRLKSDLHL
jgi:UV DNA damage endonuclease